MGEMDLGRMMSSFNPFNLGMAKYKVCFLDESIIALVDLLLDLETQPTFLKILYCASYPPLNWVDLECEKDGPLRRSSRRSPKSFDEYPQISVLGKSFPK